jgi:hypothetical protein
MQLISRAIFPLSQLRNAAYDTFGKRAQRENPTVLRLEEQEMHKKVTIATTAALLLFGSSTSFGGLTFTMVTTSDGKTSSTAQVWTDGMKMKTLIDTAVDNPLMPPGSYILVNEQGMYIVNPTASTFARFDVSMFEGMTQALSESGVANTFEFKDIGIEKTLDEAGESIEGYATRHYQFKSTWKMVVAGSPMTTQVDSVEDIWTTTELAIPAQASMSFDQVSLPPSVQELADAQGLRNVEGFPLRTVTVQTTKMDMGMRGFGAGLAQRMANRAMGGAGNVTTTMEMTDIEEVDVPAETFEIPEGYTETQLFQTGPDVPDLNKVPEGQAQTPDVPNLDEVPRD